MVSLIASRRYINKRVQVHFTRVLISSYKGTLSPLLGIGAQVSLQFGSNELIKKLLFKIYDEYLLEDDDDAETLPMSMVLASGLLTGIPSSLSVVIFFVIF